VAGSHHHPSRLLGTLEGVLNPIAGKQSGPELGRRAEVDVFAAGAGDREPFEVELSSPCGPGCKGEASTDTTTNAAGRKGSSKGNMALGQVESTGV
jgi:hypothetical protein